MNYKETKNFIKNVPIEISILITGSHGIGKSMLVKEYAKEENIPCIDIRLSQCEVGDIKGLPLIINGRTFFAPPDFFPIHEEDRKEMEKEFGIKINPSPQRGVLFLDEINRANAVRQNGLAIEYLKPEERTIEVCLEAVKNNKNAFNYLTDKEKEEVIKIDPLLINLIE